MLEKQIERKLTEEVKKRAGMCLKQTGIAGIPDRLILLPEKKSAFVELKRPGEKPRRLQEIRMKQIKKMGYEVFVIDGVEQIGRLLDEVQSS